MGTTLKLYYTYNGENQAKWELIPSRLMIVEDIATYLASKSAYTISNFQYQKNELEMAFNVDLGQSYSQPRTATNFKYVSIQNENELIHYYFVKKVTWRSKSCVRFELVLDVLNTFQEGKDYVFKADSRIVREHKDRFRKVYDTNNFTFIIDNENLNEDFTEGDIAVIRKYSDSSYLLTFQIDDVITPLFKYKAHIISGTLTDVQQDIAVRFYKLIEGEGEVANGTGTFSYKQDVYIWRNIDPINENINPVLQCGNASGEKIEDTNSILRKDWFLMYRNQNDPSDSLVNPVDCFLLPSESVPISEGSLTSGRLTTAMLEIGKFYYLNMKHSGITLSNGLTFGRYIYYNDYAIVSKQSNGKLSVVICEGGVGGTYTLIDVYSYNDIEYITLNDLPQAYTAFTLQPDTEDYIRDYLGNESDTWSNVEAENYIDPITSVDKTDAKIIKIIKLPYCPYNFNIVSGKIDLPNSDFIYETLGSLHVLKLNNLNTKLTKYLYHTTNNPLKNLYISALEDFEVNITDLRKYDYSYESKLFHSDFFQPTYYYDSFAYKVQMEKLDPSSYYEASAVNSLTMKFDMTSTINSRFMFTYYLNLRLATENYAKYMPLARNNEEVLYNVPYINYIRNGYNYDVKAKERTNTSNFIGLALSSASTIASLALPSVPLKIAGVVAGLVSMAMSIKNTVVSSLQNEENIKRKITETQNQASSVTGSDDVDLMSIYAENRLKYLVYEPSPLMKDVLFNLFFYAGYNSGRIGVPTHNNRINFDYLECEASLEAEASIPDECVQELINCFRTGVTYLHKTERVADKWDFEQEYENWETNLMED